MALWRLYARMAAHAETLGLFGADIWPSAACGQLLGVGLWRADPPLFIRGSGVCAALGRSVCRFNESDVRRRPLTARTCCRAQMPHICKQPARGIQKSNGFAENKSALRRALCIQSASCLAANFVRRVAAWPPGERVRPVLPGSYLPAQAP